MRSNPLKGSDFLAPKEPRTWLFLLAYVVILGSFLALAFTRWGYDDPYITYRYAKNVSDGIGFVYNQGEAVLSTTTPLFTLILAGMRLLAIDIPIAAIIVGSFSLALGGLLMWDLANSWKRPISGLVALVLYPTFPLLLSTLSSEIALYLFLCIGAFSMYARKKFELSAVFAGLAFLTRPDAGLIAIILLADYVLRNRRSPPLGSIAVFFLITGPWIVYTFFVFGSPIPVTLAAKQHQGSMAISLTFIPGLLKIIQQSYADIWQYWVATILGVIGTFSLFRQNMRWLPFLSWPILHAIAFVLLGVSGYFWYFAALVPGFIALVGAGVEWVFNLLQKEQIFNQFGARTLAGFGLMLAVTPIIIQGLQVQSHPDSRLGIYREIGDWLRSNTEPDATIGALEVGIIGYYGDREMVDFAGIIQPPIAQQLGPSSTYEDAALWGTETYKPDFLILNTPGYARLIETLVDPNCQTTKEFIGTPFGYKGNLVVYHCEW